MRTTKNSFACCCNEFLYTEVSSKEPMDDKKMPQTLDEDHYPSWCGVALSIGSGFLMACTSLAVKLATSLPFYELLIAKCLGTLVFGPPLMIYYKNPSIPPSLREFVFVVSRGLFGSIAIGALFFAFGHIPLGDATALVFTSPVWTAILGYFILKEGWSIYDSFAVVLSLVGVTLITRPSFIFHNDQEVGLDALSWFSYAASVGASISLALSYVCVRKVKNTGSFTMIFYYGVTGIFLGIGYGMVQGFKSPECGTMDSIYAILCASFSFCGQVCVILALKLEKAATVALGRATDIAFVFILQVIFVNSSVNALSIVGAILILSCNVSIFIKKWLASRSDEYNSKKFTCNNLENCGRRFWELL